jgi:hypothetical protein
VIVAKGFLIFDASTLSLLKFAYKSGYFLGSVRDPRK